MHHTVGYTEVYFANFKIQPETENCGDNIGELKQNCITIVHN